MNLDGYVRVVDLQEPFELNGVRQILVLLGDAADEECFAWIAERIEAYLLRRDETACRDLIVCARAFVELTQESRFTERLGDLYRCAEDGEIDGFINEFLKLQAKNNNENN